MDGKVRDFLRVKNKRKQYKERRISGGRAIFPWGRILSGLSCLPHLAKLPPLCVPSCPKAPGKIGPQEHVASHLPRNSSAPMETPKKNPNILAECRGLGVIPAQAAVQACSHADGNPANMASYFLDSRFRGNDTPGPASLEPTSHVGGETRCFLRLKCYRNPRKIGRGPSPWAAAKKRPFVRRAA